MKHTLRLLVVALIATAGLFAYAADDKQEEKRGPGMRVFELRTYTPAAGKMDALNARFRDHTCKLFEKHGMTNIGYWVTEGKEGAPPKLVYLLAHASRDAAKKSWAAFVADPDWKAAKEESEKEGKLVDKLESEFLAPTDYSKIK